LYLKKVGRQNQWWTDDVYEQKKLARKSVEVKKENLELKEENKQQGNEIFELKKENEELKKQILELKSGNTPDECPFETFVSKDFLV